MARHIHADCIIAWAEGKNTQIYYINEQKWVDFHPDHRPVWIPTLQYRIKPEPKPDIVGYAQTFVEEVDGHLRVRVSPTSFLCVETDNIKIILDGETKKLKSVEMIGD